MRREDLIESTRTELPFDGPDRAQFDAFIKEAATLERDGSRAQYKEKLHAAFLVLGERFWINRDDPSATGLFAAWARETLHPHTESRRLRAGATGLGFWPPPVTPKQREWVHVSEASRELRKVLEFELGIGQYRHVAGLLSSGSFVYLRPSDDEGFTAWVAKNIEAGGPGYRSDVDASGKPTRSFTFYDSQSKRRVSTL